MSVCFCLYTYSTIVFKLIKQFASIHHVHSNHFSVKDLEGVFTI